MQFRNSEELRLSICTAGEVAADVLVGGLMVRDVGIGEVVEGAILRGVAEAGGVAVVEEGIGIVGDAVDDLMAKVGFGEAEVNQLCEVARAGPGVQAAFVDDLIADEADADGEDVHGELVGEAGGTGFAEGLAQSVIAVGSGRGLVVDGFAPLVESDGVVAAGVDDLFDAGVFGGLEDVVRADDVGTEDFLVGEIGADLSSEMDDGVGFPGKGFDEGEIGDVALFKGFVRG